MLNKEIDDPKGVLTPTTLINGLKTQKKFKVIHEGLYILFDSGSSDSMIKMKYVDHLKLHKMSKPIRYETTAGPYQTVNKRKHQESISSWTASNETPSTAKICNTTRIICVTRGLCLMACIKRNHWCKKATVHRRFLRFSAISIAWLKLGTPRLNFKKSRKNKLW